MTTESAPAPNGVPVETEALQYLQFYQTNYDTLFFAGLTGKKKQVLGAKPFKCRFCGGEPPMRTFRNCAHTIAESLGNKTLISPYECDDCNKRFREFDDDLGKMTLPFRVIGGIKGKVKKGQKGFPTLKSIDGTRLHFHDSGIHVSTDANSSSFVVDNTSKTIAYTFSEQPYRPLGAYKALCKAAYSIIHESELQYLLAINEWLLEEDVSTKHIYGNGGHLLLQTFVPGFKPFPNLVVALLRRKTNEATPYLMFFVAYGNVTYQIFPPCPQKDSHMTGQTIQLARYPHLFQLQPWPANGQILYSVRDLSSPERTTARSNTINWKFESVVKL
jgi:hypothetical protein